MIAIIDYGINQTTELTKALTLIGTEFIVSHSEKDLLKCDKIIISDAENLSKAIKKIHLYNLFSFLRLLKKPILGISLGMDLLCSKSNDGIACLGIIESDVVNDCINNQIESVPTMEKVEIPSENKLFENINSGEEFYFLNNYHVEITNSTIATVNGKEEFSAAVQKDNFYGVQFLPEKSGKQGLQVLKNFVLNIS